ncbi:MAG: hypothetical protein ACJ8DK_10715 [Microvirga sp.]
MKLRDARENGVVAHQYRIGSQRMLKGVHGGREVEIIFETENDALAGKMAAS